MEEPEKGSPASEDRSQKTAAALRALREGLGSKLENHRRRISDVESDHSSRAQQIAEEVAHDQAAESQAEQQLHGDHVLKLRDIIAERDATIARCQRQISDAELHQLRLSAELTDLRSAMGAVRTKECASCGTLKSQLSRAEEKVADANATIAGLEARIEELCKAVAMAQEALVELREAESSECARLRTELTEQQSQIENAARNASELESRLESLTQELIQARDTEQKLREQNQAGNAAQIKAQLSVAEAQQALSARTAELAAITERESQARERVEEQLKQIESLTAELAESRDSAAKLSADNKSNDAILTEAQAAAVETQRLFQEQAAELATVAERESQAKAQVGELLAQVAALTAELDKSREAETRFTAQQSACDSTLGDLQGALAAAEQALAERDAELAKASEREISIHARSEELQLSLTEAHELLKGRETELSALAERELKSNCRIDDLVAELDVLRKQLDAAHQTEAELQSLHSADDSALAETRRVADETKRLLDERSAELATVMERETAVNLRVETLLAQVESLTADLTVAQQAASKLSAQHSATDAALAESQDTAAETRERLKESKEQLATIADREAKANARLDDLAKQFESLTTELTAARDVECELREQISTGNRALDEAKQTAQETQQSLKAEVVDLTVKRESLAEELAQVRAELAARAESATNEVSWLEREREAAEQSRKQLATDFEQLLAQQKLTEELLAEAELRSKQSAEELQQAREELDNVSHSTEDELDQASKKFELALADAQKLKRENAKLQEELARRPEVSETESPELVSLRVERDALAARVTELESAPAPTIDEDSEQRFADLQRRFELAVEDLRHQKQENAQLQEKLSRAAQQSGGHQAAASNQGMDWQAQKARLLAALESEEAEETPGPERRQELVTIEGTISITDRVVAEKDREIAELREQLTESPAERSSKSDAADVLDKDEIIAAERAKLEVLQKEWHDKLRSAELEMSVQRAALARREAEISQKQQAAQEAQSDPAIGADGKPRRRWLSALGLRDDDEKEGKK